MAAPPPQAVAYGSAAYISPQMDDSTISLVAACECVNDILDRVIAADYDKQIRAKEIPYAISRMFDELRLVIEHQMPPWDALAELHRPPEYRVNRSGTHTDARAWEAEDEPAPTPIDSWARATVPVRPPAPPALPIVEKMDARSVGSSPSVAGRLRASAGALTSRSAHTTHTAQTAHTGQTHGSRGSRGTKPVDAPAAIEEGTGGAKSASAKPKLKAAGTRGGNDEDSESPRPPMSPGGRSETANSRMREGLESRRALSRDDGAPASASRGGDLGRRDPLDPKKLKGRIITLDDRGQPMLVNPPNVSRLPSTVLPITVSFDTPESTSTSNAPARARPGGVPALTIDAKSHASAVPKPSASPKHVSRSIEPGESTRMSPRSTRREVSRMSSASVDERFFRASVGMQPALTDTIKTSLTTLSPGVSVSQGGRTIAGPEATVADSKRVTRAAFEQRQRVLARTMPSAMVAELDESLGAAVTPEDHNTAPRESAPLAGPTRVHHGVSVRGPAATAPRAASLGMTGQTLLSTIPDVIESPLTLSMRRAGDTASASPVPGSMVPIRKPDGAPGSHHAGNAHGMHAGTRVASTSPPRREPYVEHFRGASRSGTETKRQRERGTAHTVPTTALKHLPAPLFPAVAHYEQHAFHDADAMRFTESVGDALAPLQRAPVLGASGTGGNPLVRSVLSASGRQVLEWGETSRRKAGGKVTLLPGAI